MPEAEPPVAEKDFVEALAQLATTLAGERTIAGACDEVLKLGLAVTGARCAEVLYRYARTRQVVLLARAGPHPWCQAESGGRRLASRLLEKTLDERLPLCVRDVGREEALDFPLPEGSELRAAISVPLVVRGRALGAMNFCGTDAAVADEAALGRLAVLAGLLAPVIENLYVIEQVTAEEAERRQLLVRELEAVEDERRRIARELHDGLGQTLTGLAMTIDGTVSLLSQPGKEDAAMAALKRSREAASAAMRDIRRVILHLRPPALDDMGLFPALESYARRVLGDAGIELRLRVSGRAESVPSVVENVVFRATQEAINNVARHSQARVCKVELRAGRGGLRACVQDDGVGFAPDEDGAGDSHFGIRNMRERLQLIGGRIEIESKPAAGSRVEIRVPYGSGRASGNADRNR